MWGKSNIWLYLLQFISIYKCIPPTKQEKMWSEEIIARIALKLTPVPIFLFMSFWGLMYMVLILIYKSNFQLYWQHFIIDWMHPHPVKLVNNGKLLEKHGQRKFQLIFLVYRPIKYSLVRSIVKFTDHSTKNVQKIQYWIIFIVVYFHLYVLTPSKTWKNVVRGNYS